MIIGPDGRVLAESRNADEVILADLDRDVVPEYPYALCSACGSQRGAVWTAGRQVGDLTNQAVGKCLRLRRPALYSLASENSVVWMKVG
jgi:hypothetical protein